MTNCSPLHEPSCVVDLHSTVQWLRAVQRRETIGNFFCADGQVRVFWLVSAVGHVGVFWMVWLRFRGLLHLVVVF